MNWLLTIVEAVLLFGGCAFLVISGIGVLRLPDIFTRLHAAGLTDTMGAGLLILGLTIEWGLTLVTVKLLLILLFIWATSPVASHALAKIALRDGFRPLLANDDPEEPPSNS
jgi:multicomponent Na+:H+ antiporter subunit G